LFPWAKETLLEKLLRDQELGRALRGRRNQPRDRMIHEQPRRLKKRLQLRLHRKYLAFFNII